MAGPEIRDNGLNLSYRPEAALEVSDATEPLTTSPVASPPLEANVANVESAGERSWFERVRQLVRVAAAANPSVAGAYVSRDGRQVFITAPTRTEDLVLAGANLIATLLDELKPDPDHWIEGGFSARADDERVPPDDCVWVFQRPRR